MRCKCYFKSFWHIGGGNQTKAHPDRLWNQLNFIRFQISATIIFGEMFGRKAWSPESRMISSRWRKWSPDRTGWPLRPSLITFPDVRAFFTDHFQWVRTEACRQATLAPSLLCDEAMTAELWFGLVMSPSFSSKGYPSCRAEAPFCVIAESWTVVNTKPHQPVYFLNNKQIKFRIRPPNIRWPQSFSQMRIDDLCPREGRTPFVSSES